MSQPQQIAILGCGWAGKRHAVAFQHGGAAVCWAVDSDANRAASLARSYANVHTATDYHAALADPNVDAVTICLPHALHAQVAVDALASGKHVLCEKPIASTLEDADRMIAAAQQVRKILMIAENVRFNPLFHAIRKLLDEGVIGQPALIQMTREAYLTQSFLTERRWFLDRHAASGGMMMSGGIHDIETLRMLNGEVTSVYALQARQRFVEMEGDDTSSALLRFENGAAGTLVESFVMKSLTTASGSEVHTLRIDGDLGSVTVSDGQTIRIFSEHADWQRAERLVQHEIHVAPADTFQLEIEHFLDCVRTGQEPLTSGRAQRRSLEVVLAAYHSMESGLVVQIG